MSEESKVRSLRADDETYEKFKQLADSEFGNQGQCLSTLINLYETEKSKAILVNRGLEIESFQDYMNKISSLFITSLQLNQDAEERIRGEFARQLESKDRTIFDLQTKVDDLSTIKDNFEESSNILRDENKRLQETIVSLEEIKNRQTQEYASTLADKDNLNKALTDSCNERKIEIEKLQTTINDTAERLKLQNTVEAENKTLATEIEKLKSEIDRQKEIAALDKEKALLMSDKEHQQELTEIHSQQHEEIKEYINRINVLQEQLEASRNEIMQLNKATTKTGTSSKKSTKTK